VGRFSLYQNIQKSKGLGIESMAAPYGNKNGVKGKRWEEALRRALSRAGGSVSKGLDPIASKVVAAAQAGEIEAIREIANRLDGKPTETVHQTIENHYIFEERVRALRDALRPAEEAPSVSVQ
jgi:hypothetical protein